MEIPNELYTAFSFIGFVMCAIPFYWHLEGTCDYSRGGGSWSNNAPRSLEYRHMLVHGLDRRWLSNAVCQLDRLEQQHDKQGPGLL
jgi:hypothetical protein